MVCPFILNHKFSLEIRGLLRSGHEARDSKAEKFPHGERGCYEQSAGLEGLIDDRGE